MKAPISVCMMVRNESSQLEACIKSFRPYVEELCIVDTGSVDGTQDIARKYADKFEVYEGCNDDQGRIRSFAMGRNYVFSLASCPWRMWVDGDDEMVGADRLADLIAHYEQELALTNKATSPSMIYLPYELSHDERGNCTMVSVRERIFTPWSAFKWVGAIHEVVMPRAGVVEPERFYPPSDRGRGGWSTRLVHRRNFANKIAEPGRNLRLLKLEVEENPTEARPLYYLGLAYGDAGMAEEAIACLTRYVSMSAWDDEKCMACLRLCNHYEWKANARADKAIGEYEKAIEWALKAITVKETWGETYFAVARCYCFIAQRTGNRRDWERSAHFGKLGFQQPVTQSILFMNPLERKVEAHRFLNLALNSIGDVQGALDSVMSALQHVPNDVQLNMNKKIYEDYLEVHRKT